MLNLVVAGLAAGGTYALIGVCIVFLHRMAAVVNFSATLGPAVAVLALSSFVNDWELNLWVAIVMTIVLGGLIAGTQGWLMARFFKESTVLVRSTVTMAMGILFLAVGIRIFGDSRRPFPVLFNSLGFKVGDVRVSGQVIVSFLGAILAGLLLGGLLKYTRAGVILRAISARPVTAELMGVRASRAVVGVWALAGVMTTAGIILVAPTRASLPNMAVIVIPALAAAVFGRLESFWIAIVGGTMLGVLESASLNMGSLGNYRPSLSFLIIIAALVWSQRKETWSEAR
jgi:branched-chain amino acid transport system permease protein